MLCTAVIVLHDTKNNKKTVLPAWRTDFYQ
jgi:hypothetical protein